MRIFGFGRTVPGDAPKAFLALPNLRGTLAVAGMETRDVREPIGVMAFLYGASFVDDHRPTDAVRVAHRQILRRYAAREQTLIGASGERPWVKIDGAAPGQPCLLSSKLAPVLTVAAKKSPNTMSYPDIARAVIEHLKSDAGAHEGMSDSNVTEIEAAVRHLFALETPAPYTKGGVAEPVQPSDAADKFDRQRVMNSPLDTPRSAGSGASSVPPARTFTTTSMLVSRAMRELGETNRPPSAAEIAALGRSDATSLAELVVDAGLAHEYRGAAIDAEMQRGGGKDTAARPHQPMTPERGWRALRQLKGVNSHIGAAEVAVLEKIDVHSLAALLVSATDGQDFRGAAAIDAEMQRRRI